MNAYDRLMFEYYKVLNNAWNREIKDAAKQSILHLSQLSYFEKINEQYVDDLMFLINQSLGEEFSSEVIKETKIFMEKSFKYGLSDVNKQLANSSISIGLYGASDAKIATIAQKQQLFWIGEHFNTDIRDKFKTSIMQAIDKGYTKRELVDLFKTEFAGIKDKSSHYWQGLAEHTSLRIREFGRLEGYRKAGATGYKLINPMDSRTSDICYALVSQDLVYPLNDALEIRDKLLSIDMHKVGLERAREEIKALAPWVTDKMIVRNKKGAPIGVNGAHTPFPPFHWKCRTETRIS